MSFETAFLEFMPHTITVYPFSSVNQYGEETFGSTGTQYRCMVEERPNLILSSYGEEVVASHNVYVHATERIPLTSRVVLPDGSEPTLLRSDTYTDETGDIHHVALFFGSGARGG